MISLTEAALLISKIESEERPLSVTFSSQDGAVRLVLKARVAWDDENETLALLTEDKAVSLLRLNACKFEYHDERIYPENLRGALARNSSGTLQILFPSGGTLSLHMPPGDSADEQ